MLGWRKLSAWALVFAFGAAATFMKTPVDPIVSDMIKWVTAFFFGANAIKPAAQAVKAKLDP